MQYYSVWMLLTMADKTDDTGDRPSNRILRRADVLAKIRLSRTTLWRLQTRGQFPSGFWLSPGLLGWREADVDRWLDDRRGLGGRVKTGH